MEYESGVCNINQEESKKRYLTGGLSLTAGLIFSYGYAVMSFPSYYLIFGLIAYTSGFIGLLQGRKNFCVKHARQGTQKTGENSEEVQDEEKVKEDKNRANRIVLKSLAGGTLVTATVYLLGALVF
jgi:hypothetical protein